MSVPKHRVVSFILAVLASSVLVSPEAALASDTSRIHPKKIELLHGVVTAVRTVPAYAAALGASTGQMGVMSCHEYAIMKITASTIFRVETASRYFDLSKLCTNDMAFDYAIPSNIRYSWNHWQQLHAGETVTFRVVKRTAQLSIPRCENLGLLSKAQTRLAFNRIAKISGACPRAG